jgi:hypothetical protein
MAETIKTVNHISWPVCHRCGGFGTLNETGQLFPEGGVVGPCPECKELGRTRPKDWKDPVVETHQDELGDLIQVVIDPGSHPDFQAAFKAQQKAAANSKKAGGPVARVG